jgi:transposase-like protein
MGKVQIGLLMNLWKWYNKVDTKIREKCKRVGYFMRKSYDKQFKIAAVKLVLEDELPVADAAEALSIHYNS